MDEIIRQFFVVGGAMWRRRWIGLAVAWLVAAVGVVIVSRTPDRYESSARVYVDTQTVLKPLLAGLTVQPNIDEQIGMLSRTIVARPNIERILHGVNPEASAATQIERDQMVDSLTKRIRFTGSVRENIYTIAYQDTSPERSKRVVQDLLALFVESGVGDKRRDNESARRFIDEQIKVYEQKLAEAENRLKEFKLKNMGVTSGTGADYFTRVSALTEEAAKGRQELRSAEVARDAFRRELTGEEPIMLPDPSATAAGAFTSEYDARIDTQRKQLDDLLRRYTEQHPDVLSTRRLLTQLEEQRKQEIDTRRKAAAQSPPRLSASTNPVVQRLKFALAEAEANIASLRARVSETEGRLAQLRAIGGKAPGIEADLAQLNRDYAVLQKNYAELVSRRESASMGGEVDSAGQLAEFRIIDPPRIAPNPVFPNRLALIFVVLLAALAAGGAASFAMARVFPTFHGVGMLREFTQRPVLGSVSVLETSAVLWRRRLSNVAFAGAFAMLLVAHGMWGTWVAMNTRV